MVRRSRDRVVETVPVELFPAGGVKIRGVSQDLSTGGVFVRTKSVLPVGLTVEVDLHITEPPIRVPATVVHALSPEEARALGRIPGLGLAFGELAEPARNAIITHIGRVKTKQAASSTAAVEDGMRVVVADGETRLLERLSTALGRAGFQVVTCSSGVEAYAACIQTPPDVVVAELHLPVLDGLRLVQSLGERSELAEIPILMMSEDSGDLRRLQAYQLGVMDFLPKPFTVVELCIRVRRLATHRQEKARRVVLRGQLEKIGFTTLLSLFGHDRKSGVLTVTGDDDVAWISLSGGQVVKARALGTDVDSLETLMLVLSWQVGHFEFTACDVNDDDEVGMGTTQLLLEHARRLDERSRRS